MQTYIPFPRVRIEPTTTRFTVTLCAPAPRLAWPGYKYWLTSLNKYSYKTLTFSGNLRTQLFNLQNHVRWYYTANNVIGAYIYDLFILPPFVMLADIYHINSRWIVIFQFNIFVMSISFVLKMIVIYFYVKLKFEINIIIVINKIKYISFTLFPAYSRVGSENILLRHFVPHFLLNSGGIACWVAELSAALCQQDKEFQQI